jgi:alginate O-acetyltransferase complex protein AlgI
MLFNSNVFLFAFLPIALALFYAARQTGNARLAYFVLFALSFYFYAYWSFKFGLLFLASISCNYLVGRRLMVAPSKALLTAAIVANLTLLGYFKYVNFFLEQISHVYDMRWAITTLVLPIGISFYTFQQSTFLVDAYRGRIKEPSFVRYGLFVSFFPHLIAGPIVHHSDMMPQFNEAHGTLSTNFALGVLLFAMGLAKKTLIADPIGVIASDVFDPAAKGVDPNFAEAWIAALAYTFQIYFDFSAYSDMAYGLAIMFGIRLPANFFSPYKSRDIIDFWRRWHMTLSRLLRDYIYIPLGGNRKGETRRHVNLMATMLIGGFWHGAGWNFILWGGLHGAYLVINHFWNQFTAGRRGLGWFGPVLTFLCVVVAWVPFRAHDMGVTTAFYSAMIGLKGFAMPLEAAQVLALAGIDVRSWGVELYAPNERVSYYFGLATVGVAMLIAFLAPNLIELTARYQPVLNTQEVMSSWGKTPVTARGRIERMRAAIVERLAWRPSVGWGLAAGLIIFIGVKMVNTTSRSEFLYYQF